MTLAQVAATTRIRATVVAAIEADDFHLCGGDVYARGHLKSIATAVGIDPTALAAQFDAERGNARATAATVEPILQPTRVMEASSTGGGLGLGALAGTLGASMHGDRKGANWTAVMALALVAIVAVGAISILSNRTTGTPAASNPTVGASSTPTPSVSPSTSTSSAPSAGSTSPTPSGSPDVVAEADGVSVGVTVTGRASWVRATTGAGKTLFEGTMNNGDTKTFRDKTKVKLLLGNAGAVTLLVNGKDLGAPGTSGQVLKTEFGPGDPTNPSA
jgi:cytoskeleton protein RodZ